MTWLLKVNHVLPPGCPHHQIYNAFWFSHVHWKMCGYEASTCMLVYLLYAYINELFPEILPQPQNICSTWSVVFVRHVGYLSPPPPSHATTRRSMLPASLASLYEDSLLLLGSCCFWNAASHRGFLGYTVFVASCFWKASFSTQQENAWVVISPHVTPSGIPLSITLTRWCVCESVGNTKNLRLRGHALYVHGKIQITEL